MVHGLYRFYLYFVATALLLFAAVGAFLLLRDVFAGTSLRGAYAQPPTHANTVQAILIFAVSWLIALLLGGPHYWLIRRDQRTDSGAGRGAVRAFFLNWIESWSAAVLAGSGAYTLSNLGAPYQSDVSWPLALAIVSAGLVIVLELERRRAMAGQGAARVFQRLNVYGTQLVILLGVGTFAWINALDATVRNWLITTGRVSNDYCGFASSCALPQVAGPWLAALFVAGVWVSYALLARGDDGSLMRQLLHLAGFVVGLGFALSGLSQLVELLLRGIFALPFSWQSLIEQYSFIPPLVFGVVVLADYTALLLREAGGLPSGRSIGLVIEAVAAVVLGAWFWVGCGFALHDAVAQLALPAHPGRDAWAYSLAVLVAGLAYVVVVPHLYLRTSQTAAAAPLRGYTYLALGAGVLTTAIAGAVTLYAVGTQLLGAPLTDWDVTARNAGEAAAVGAAILAVHLVIALRQRYFRGAAEPAQAPTPAPVSAPAPLPPTPPGTSATRPA